MDTELELDFELVEIAQRLREKDQAGQKQHEERNQGLRPLAEIYDSVRKLCWGDENTIVITRPAHHLQISSKEWAPLWCQTAKTWGRYPGYEKFPLLNEDAPEGVKLGYRLFELAKTKSAAAVVQKLEGYRKALGRRADAPMHTNRREGDTEDGLWWFTLRLYEYIKKLVEDLDRKNSKSNNQLKPTVDQDLSSMEFERKCKLDQTDKAILQELKKKSGKRLLTGTIADNMNRDRKVIGKNLVKLKELGLIDNISKKGYQITPKGKSLPL